MTQEQYNRAIGISKRLAELKEVQYAMDTYHSLVLADGDRTKIFSSYINGSISDILSRHDKMIRAEINEEIEKLKKEIEEL